MWCPFLLRSKVNQLCVYIYLFFVRFFPIQFITQCRVEFPVLYRRSLLVICFIGSGVYMPIPNSQFIPLPSFPRQ